MKSYFRSVVYAQLFSCVFLFCAFSNISFALIPNELFGVLPDKKINKNRDINIVATLGKEGWTNVPVFCQHGANIFRINGSHIKSDKMLIEILTNTIQAIKNNIACKNAEIMYDTQGPEVRTRIVIDEKYKANAKEHIGYNIAENDFLVIHTNLADKEIIFKGDYKKNKNKPKIIHIGVNYSAFLNDVKIDNDITIENRDVYAKVVGIDAEKQTIKLKITSINTDNHKYYLTDRRHINLLGGSVSQPTFTEYDKTYIKIAHSFGVKYYALSFVRDENDIKHFHEIIKSSVKQDCENCIVKTSKNKFQFIPLVFLCSVSYLHTLFCGVGWFFGSIFSFGVSSSLLSFLTCSSTIVSMSSSVANNSSRETPYNFARQIRLSVSGEASALSHLLTACLDKPNLSANSSCEYPYFFLNFTNLSAISIVITMPSSV